jgi:hypothetical protein
LIIESFRGAKEVWHSGGSEGYSAWLGRYPEHGLSIATLCNSDAVSSTALSRSVIAEFLPAAAGAPPVQAPARTPGGTAAAAEVNSKAGLFFSEGDGRPLILLANEGGLRMPGARGPMTAVTEGRFRPARSDMMIMSQDEFELNFLSNDELEYRSMEGKTTRYMRAKPFAPTPADLAAIAGRYESDELGAAYRMTQTANGLMMSLDLSTVNGSELRPVHTDTFQRGGTIVRFVRDKAGKVVALNYSNPVLRRVTIPKATGSDGRPTPQA